MKNVPPAPEPFVIEEKAKKNLDAWIAYLRGLSTRIKVFTPFDEKFDLEKWKEYAKSIANSSESYDKIQLIGWPQKEDVAFLLCFSSALPELVGSFGKDDAFVFCFGDRTFGISYFESDGNFRSDLFSYSLDSYPDSALSWTYVASLIKSRLQEIENQVPTAKI